MAVDNLLGSSVRIRRGWHGGRIGKVIVCERAGGLSLSYSVIKVQLEGNNKVVNINSVEELEKLADLPSDQVV